MVAETHFFNQPIDTLHSSDNPIRPPNLEARAPARATCGFTLQFHRVHTCSSRAPQFFDAKRFRDVVHRSMRVACTASRWFPYCVSITTAMSEKAAWRVSVIPNRSFPAAANR